MKQPRIEPHASVPYLCQIELTYRCNSNCIFCYNPNRYKPLNILLVDQVVRSVSSSRIPHVYLIGGEPSLFSVEKLNEYINLLSEHSSVTIVTNGLIKLISISEKLACFGVPIHGSDQKTHEFHTRTPGSFMKTLETIRHYIDRGFDVRCIPVLTNYNYDQMYDIIKLAASLGMESIYVDRYEDGGIGAKHSNIFNIKPSLEQFRQAVGQIIRAKNDFAVFAGRVGFGTAIPYCLDERLADENMLSNCGVGVDFCAINPEGGLRLCNQSELVLGNILDEPIECIWKKPTLDVYRDLSWVTEPCRSCDLLLDCTGGCKVDVNHCKTFCIDYAVRGCSRPDAGLVEKVRRSVVAPVETYPVNYRFFRANRYAKLTTRHPERLLVTRYQTVKVDDMALEMSAAIIGGTRSEQELIDKFSNRVDEHDVRVFVSQLFQVQAIDPADAEDT